MLLEKIANELRSYAPSGKIAVDNYATKVASNYLHGGKNMTDQIKKLAETEHLSDEYVKRICEASNHKVSSHLFETNSDKNFQFDVAKWEDILSAPEEKTASVYDEKPVHYKISSIKLAQTNFEKEALIGPAADMALFGAPSIIGYGVGRHMGNKSYEKEEEWEPSMAKTMLIPGYLGYSMGKGNTIEDRFIKDYNEGNKPKLQPDMYNTGKFVKSPKQEVKEAEQNPYYTKTDPMENLLDMKDLLSRAEEDVRLKVAYVGNEMNHVYKQLYDEFGDEVRYHGYFKMAQALVPYMDAGLIESLTYDGLNNNLIKEEDLFTIEKVASEPVNEECDLLKFANYYCRLESEYAQYKLAHKEITEQLELVRNTLKRG